MTDEGVVTLTTSGRRRRPCPSSSILWWHRGCYSYYAKATILRCCCSLLLFYLTGSAVVLAVRTTTTTTRKEASMLVAGTNTGIRTWGWNTLGLRNWTKKISAGTTGNQHHLPYRGSTRRVDWSYTTETATTTVSTAFTTTVDHPHRRGGGAGRRLGTTTNFGADQLGKNNILPSSTTTTFRRRRRLASITAAPTRRDMSSSETTKTTICPPISIISSSPKIWSDLTSTTQINDIIIPTLSTKSHKGSSGRIGIVGGNERYTGAPYYAAMASLHVGSDLAFVFTAEEAAIPIKCYSPELMVADVYNAKEFQLALAMEDEDDGGEEERTRLVKEMCNQVVELFDRMHVLIIGPGLGRCPLVLRATSEIIREALHRKLPLVLDADALYMLTLEPYRDLFTDVVEEGGCDVVMTPNVMEYRRLLDSCGGSQEEFEKRFGGVVMVKKGRYDEVIRIASSSSRKRGSGTASEEEEEEEDDKIPDATTVLPPLVCEEEGGLKRSGGLGDVLSGTIGTFVAWNAILGSREEQDEGSCNRESSSSSLRHEALLQLSCWSACCVAKKATKAAFDRKRRAMTAPDVLDALGVVVEEMTSSSGAQQQTAEEADEIRHSSL